MPVIVMTAYGSIEDAVAAMKEGALDFLAKPVDPDHLLLLVARALEQRRIVTENLLLKEELAVRRGAPQLVGEDPSLRKVFASLQRAAATDTTVLLEGESGTGKELFARSLHALSAARRRAVRRDQLRRDSRDAARDRAVRSREGRVHRRRRAQAGQVRDGASRHAVPRRDRRSAAVAAGEDPARARGATVRARRRHRVGPGRRAARRRDQPRSARGGRGAAVPRGSVLPPVGVPDHGPAAARSARRHPAAGALSSSIASAAT